MPESRIDELRRRLERDPGSRLFAQLAEEHRKAGERAEAVRVARAGLAVHPVYASARLTLGRALLEMGDAAGARQELEQALRQAPDNILASRYLSQALQQLGERAAALRQYQATLAMSPGDQALAALVKDLEAEVAAGAAQAAPAQDAAPTAKAPTLPPPVPGTAARGSAAGAGAAVVATVRLPGVPPIRSTAIPAPAAPSGPPAGPAAAPVPTPSTEEARDTTEKGGVTLPPVRADERTAALAATETDRSAPPPEAAAGDAAGGSGEVLPFSSSTLAELYLRQGLQEKALEVYRQVLAEDPGNERARARLAALQAVPCRPAPPSPADGPASRRQVLERQIAGLEAMLGSLRRR